MAFIHVCVPRRNIATERRRAARLPLTFLPLQHGAYFVVVVIWHSLNQMSSEGMLLRAVEWAPIAVGDVEQEVPSRRRRLCRLPGSDLMRQRGRNTSAYLEQLGESIGAS